MSGHSVSRGSGEQFIFRWLSFFIFRERTLILTFVSLSTGPAVTDFTSIHLWLEFGEQWFQFVVVSFPFIIVLFRFFFYRSFSCSGVYLRQCVIFEGKKKSTSILNNIVSSSITMQYSNYIPELLFFLLLLYWINEMICNG